jgi:hypothetical protein
MHSITAATEKDLFMEKQFIHHKYNKKRSCPFEGATSVSLEL